MTVALADALASVRARIEAATARAGRRAEDVTLVAVTKGIPAERVAEALALGLRDFGENRVQEMEDKRRVLDVLATGGGTSKDSTSGRDGKEKDRVPAGLAGVSPRWHMIGTLQRNKVRSVVGAAVLVHSVDSIELARAIGARARAMETVQSVLLQVNVSGEATKHGFAPAQAPRAVEEAAGIEGIAVCGLMTMAAPGDRERARAAFRVLRTLRDRVADTAPSAVELSMGMSEDFEEAIEEGATMVRIGSALFGARGRNRVEGSAGNRTERAGDEHGEMT